MLRCWLVSAEPLDFLRGQEKWTGLKSIGAVESERAVRAHWEIESRLHWTLDMAFGEDGCGIWQDHAPESLAKLHKIALNLLRQEKKSKRGQKAKSKMASRNNDYLLRILLQESR